jgi:hypothetical protein
MNEQFRETDNKVHKTQDEDKQSKVKIRKKVKKIKRKTTKNKRTNITQYVLDTTIRKRTQIM